MEGVTKKKLLKNCSDIHESNHALKNFIHSNSNRDHINISALPWLLMEQQSDAIKEVIRKIRFPIGFSANINTLISKKSEFGPGLKTHDWHTFIKVSYVLLYLQYIHKLRVLFFMLC